MILQEISGSMDWESIEMLSREDTYDDTSNDSSNFGDKDTIIVNLRCENDALIKDMAKLSSLMESLNEQIKAQTATITQMDASLAGLTNKNKMSKRKIQIPRWTSKRIEGEKG